MRNKLYICNCVEFALEVGIEYLFYYVYSNNLGTLISGELITDGSYWLMG